MTRKPWDLDFEAHPREVPALRRLIRMTLEHWGLHGVVHDAQICVSELTTNVITHVGVGAPVTLRVEMNGPYVRIELRDPAPTEVPTLRHAHADEEAGRGMALIAAVAARWGVLLRVDSKVTWCELATGLRSPTGHTADPRVDRVEALFALYRTERISWGEAAPSPLSIHTAKESAIELISDVLHWLRAHGHDPEKCLDCAQTRFEVEAGLMEGDLGG